MRLLHLLALMAAVLVPASAATAETAAERALAQQIGRDLKESGQFRNYQIGVKYQDGVVWLGGTVANASQKETAIRLAQQMDGVARVVSQLRYPGDAVAGSGQQAPNIFNASDESQPAFAQNGPSPVVHAFSNGGAAGAQRSRPMMRTNSQGRVNLASARGNMPLPSPRPSAGSGGYGVRQVNAQGVYNAGGMYPQGCAPGAMGGGGPMGGMGGPAGAMGGAAGGMGGDGAVPVGFVPHGSGRGPSYDNASDAGLCLAELCVVPELRGADAIRSSIRRRPGRTSVRSIPIRRCRWRGARCRWNGMTAGGSSTSALTIRATSLAA